MRARQVFATLLGGGIGQALPLGLMMVAVNMVASARQNSLAITPLIMVLSFALFVVLGGIIAAILFLAPFWWLAKRRKLNLLSALIAGLAVGTILTAIGLAAWAVWWRASEFGAFLIGLIVDTEILTLCGAIGAWAGWRLTEPKRVLPVGTAEMF